MMKVSRYYQVAGHRFCVTAGADDFRLMVNYKPFSFAPESEEAREGLDDCMFSLTVDSGEPPAYVEELRQEEEGQEIACGKTADGMPVFEFIWWGASAGYLVCATDYREGRLILTGRHTKMAIDNALMVLFALATATKGTVLFHAAVVSHEGRGSGGAHRQRRPRCGLRLALERQDTVLPQRELPAGSHRHTESGALQQD